MKVTISNTPFYIDKGYIESKTQGFTLEGDQFFELAWGKKEFKILLTTIGIS